jgi:hypothetical protein
MANGFEHDAVIRFDGSFEHVDCKFRRLRQIALVFFPCPLPMFLWVLEAERIAVMDLGFLSEPLDVNASDVIQIFLLGQAESEGTSRES